MSQRLDAMRRIDREAGVEGYVLRPLCAKWLDPTIPEKEGLVDRQKLLAIRGRSRKDQMQLADVFHLKDYPCPAGGCLLTDPEFGARMRDLSKHCDATLNDVHLLKMGRHFRLDVKTKAVVGRNESDNKKIQTFARAGDLLLELAETTGPLVLLRGETSEPNVRTAAALAARYSKAHAQPSVKVKVQTPRRASAAGACVETCVEVTPIEPAKADAMMIGRRKK
jgi:tRNA U34 2-thiouridine synthase MnmA/TrmU